MVRSPITESVLWRSNSELFPMKCWIFAEVFEISSIHRRAIDVHTRAQQKVRAFGLCVPADFRAYALGQRRIPCGSQGNSARHGCGRSEITDTDRAVGHLQARQPKSREGADKKIVHTSEHVDLFFQRHPAED